MKNLTSTKQLELKAVTIREDMIKMLEHAGSGHSGGPLGMADIFTALYFNILNHNPKKPWNNDRDRVILSNGHICPIWYTTLAHAGYFPIKELMTLRKLNTRLQGHPHIHSAPGIENTAGPLGQGSSFAVGIALAAKMDRKKHRVYCLQSDGELEEGQSWEAYMFAAAKKLDNLTFIIDRNNIQIDGNTEDIMPLEPLHKKLESFNLHVIEIDGHNFKEIISACNKAKKIKKPSVILANTVPGKGVSFMEHDYHWHGKPPNKEEAVKALQDLHKIKRSILNNYKIINNKNETKKSG
ncbi:transketolase [Candidatus Woesearchaeota archaeon]|nr:transketolase [Candidatus Woesearchaeota archaeon]